MLCDDVSVRFVRRIKLARRAVLRNKQYVCRSGPFPKTLPVNDFPKSGAALCIISAQKICILNRKWAARMLNKAADAGVVLL
jgi:hypothetical protein